MRAVAGVFVAPFLLVAALTGLVYTFTPQLDQLVYG
ncbi:PepSY domain-containing protein, partial [Streptomyces litmocidini]